VERAPELLLEMEKAPVRSASCGIRSRRLRWASYQFDRCRWMPQTVVDQKGFVVE